MTTITEDLDTPAADTIAATIDIALTDLSGQPIVGVHSGKRIVGTSRTTTTAADGTWQATLPANTEIDTPGGVGSAFRLVRRIDRRIVADDLVIVPTGTGPFPVEDITVTQLLPPPEVTPSTLIDSVQLTTTFGPVAAPPLGLLTVPIPGTVVTIPDDPRPMLVRGKGLLQSTVVPTVLTLAIGLPSSENESITDMTDIAPTEPASADTDVTGWAEEQVDPHSPGQRQLFITGTGGGDIQLTAALHAKARIQVLAV